MALTPANCLLLTVLLIAIAVAAFANSDGGQIIIGKNDEGEISEYFEKGKWAMYKGVGPIALRWFKDQAKEKFHNWKKFKKCCGKAG